MASWAPGYYLLEDKRGVGLLTGHWEAAVLNLLYKDYQNLDTLSSGLRQRRGYSERVLVETLESLERRELVKLYRLDGSDGVYVELTAEDDAEPLSIWFRATDAGRAHFDAHSRTSRWLPLWFR